MQGSATYAPGKCHIWTGQGEGGHAGDGDLGCEGPGDVAIHSEGLDSVAGGAHNVPDGAASREERRDRGAASGQLEYGGGAGGQDGPQDEQQDGLASDVGQSCDHGQAPLLWQRGLDDAVQHGRTCQCDIRLAPSSELQLVCSLPSAFPSGEQMLCHAGLDAEGRPWVEGSSLALLLAV